jgi:antitoxin (DNA-binding transcriptional repressor) of toxin-antitoxin stability system
MNVVINTKELRASLPELVAKVRRGARFTVLYRSRPAFQMVPVEADLGTLPPLKSDPLYRAKSVGRSTDGCSASGHDQLLYRK